MTFHKLWRNIIFQYYFNHSTKEEIFKHCFPAKYGITHVLGLDKKIGNNIPKNIGIFIKPF